MEQMYFVVNIDRCWGCRACQTACKWEHGLLPGDFVPVESFRLEIPTQPQPRCEHLPVLCMHCDSPACIPACPKGALYRDDQGLVQLREEQCVGCGLCAKACPYGAVGLRTLPSGQHKAAKCDLCAQRRSRGFLTSCEQHCLGGALTSCTSAQLEEIVAPFPYRWSVGRTVYVSTRLADLGKNLPQP